MFWGWHSSPSKHPHCHYLACAPLSPLCFSRHQVNGRLQTPVGNACDISIAMHETWNGHAAPRSAPGPCHTVGSVSSFPSRGLGRAANRLTLAWDLGVPSPWSSPPSAEDPPTTVAIRGCVLLIACDEIKERNGKEKKVDSIRKVDMQLFFF